MKVLFCLRHNFYESNGGAQIQIVNTIDGLRKLGVSCEVTLTPYGNNYNDFDILHLTDLTWVYDNLEYLAEIRKQNFRGKKVLSTIYWPFDDYASNGAPLIQKIIFKIFGINGFEYAKALAKFVVHRKKIYLAGLSNSYIRNQIRIVREFDMLLPNAQEEMNALNKRLGLKLVNYQVVNNAIDTVLFKEIKKANKDPKLDNLITFVGRIDARKNQIGFLMAMMNTSYDIVFIGSPGPNSKGYHKKLLKLSNERGRVTFVSHITQSEVFKYMLKAKVNVLTSWIETPGLVSLEAAYAGCNLVVCDRGSVKEYFENFAFYAIPDNPQSIKKTVNEAMSSPFKEGVENYIEENFSWSITANQTLQAYKKSIYG